MNTKTIKFDLNKYKLYEKIKAKQGDTKSRFLLFNLLDGSIPFSLENRSVRVYAVKPDRTEVFNDLIITDAAKGYCILELTTQMLAVAGTVRLELMVIEEDKKLTSNIFYMDVKESINSEKAVVSTNEFTALMNGLAALSEYDIYKSNAKQVPGIKEEVSNLSSQLDKNINYGILSKSTFDGITKKENIFSVLGGIDSLTNGAGTSNNNYGYYLERQLWNNYGFGGYGYVGFQNNSISQMGSWNLSGFKTLETTDQSQYPGKYSFDNKGCYADNASNGYINFNFKNKNHTRAKVIYLKQPNGGTFNFSWVMSTKSELINTSSDTFELGVTELSELNNNAQYKGVSCSNCNGKLLIFGVYLYNEKGAIFTRLGKGGDKLINHAKTDDVFRGKWLEVLNPDIYLFNGGANDKDDWNGETYLSYLTKYLTPFISNDVHIVCIRCNDISGDNNWNEIFEPILEKFVKDNRLDYISDKKILGDYEFAMSNGYMLEGIHPSELGNKKRANFYSSFLNLPTVNFNNAISSESSELAYQYENKLTEKYLKVLNGTTSIIYKLGISNAYTIGLLTLNVIGQRNGSNHMSEKTYKIAINNGTVPNQVTSIGNLSVINNYEYHSGVNPTVDFTLGVNLVDNLLEISISPNTGTSDMNFYIKGNIVMTYLTVKGQCVWEN